MSGKKVPISDNEREYRRIDSAARAQAWKFITLTYPREWREVMSQMLIDHPDWDKRKRRRYSERLIARRHQDEFSMVLLLEREKRLREAGWQSAHKDGRHA